MAAVLPTPQQRAVEPRWGLGDALVGWVLAYLGAGILGLGILRAAGYTAQQIQDQDVPLSMIALSNLPLWVGFVGAAVFAARVKGRGLVADFRARVAWPDLPTGVVAGVLAQLVLVPLLAWPVLVLSGKTLDDLERPARELSERATSTSGTVLFFLIVVVCAPIAEELFFRGLVLRAIEKRFGLPWAVAGSSLFFGATHFQPLQFLALSGAGAVFALVAVRADRLGAAIIAHMAFNAVTAISLVWLNG